jgi:hypothetical protein
MAVIPVSTQDTQQHTVISGIANLLSTVSGTCNQVGRIALDVIAPGGPPWTSARSQDWASLVGEVKRISSGRATVFEITIKAYDGEKYHHDSLLSHTHGILSRAFSSCEHIEYRFGEGRTSDHDLEL